MNQEAKAILEVKLKQPKGPAHSEMSVPSGVIEKVRKKRSAALRRSPEARARLREKAQAKFEAKHNQLKELAHSDISVPTDVIEKVKKKLNANHRRSPEARARLREKAQAKFEAKLRRLGELAHSDIPADPGIQSFMSNSEQGVDESSIIGELVPVIFPLG
ncbi:hypothetical protein BDQ17DRAFT_1536667 [Cyathus striatus]|nr:hypothetical protein BDQ17DRAFT_1536667 [Cyathus striatus]